MLPLLWPNSLLLLGGIPILIFVYFWILRRRKRFTVRFSSLALVRPAPRQHSWRRHFPFALFLLALASLVTALARPYTLVSLPSDRSVILLALDVSRSMCSPDIPPTRLQAAESAALDFIHRQKPTTEIGVVAFSGYAELIQSPTADPERLQAALQSLMLGATTAIGSGILKSLDAIAEADPSVFPSQPLPDIGPSDDPAAAQVTPPPLDLPRRPDIIILLSDGVNNTGPGPLEAALQAAERGVRIYTIGFGSADVQNYPNCPAQTVGGDPTRILVPLNVDSYNHHHGIGDVAHDQYQAFSLFDGSSAAANSGFPRGIDEETLKKVAALTGGTYSPAASASQLQQVFDGLPVARVLHRTVDELSVWFSALGAILAALSIGLSWLWRPL